MTPLGLSFSVADNAVTQNGQPNSAHVFDVRAVLSGEGRLVLGCYAAVLRRAQSRASAEVFFDLIRVLETIKLTEDCLKRSSQIEFKNLFERKLDSNLA